MSTNAADLAYQARQYAMSLQAAGVDWLPANSTIDATRSEQSHQELSVELSTEVTDVSRPEALEPGDLEQRRVSLQVMDQKEVQNCVRCPDLVR
ncbi:MAG TPA: hypothetical protein PKA06_16950, partial [Gemmatales bacterium]|nr:hypothetical protein [Gemmatales bacterium]